VRATVAASKSTIGVNNMHLNSDVHALVVWQPIIFQHQAKQAPVPRRKVGQLLALIAYTIHTLDKSLGLRLESLSPVVLLGSVGAAETREATGNAITRTEMRERRMFGSTLRGPA
jgi:hypothetical protein